MRRFALVLIALSLAACGHPLSDVDAANTYDAVSILGFGAPSGEPLPVPNSGEVVVRYGGWSLRELAETEAGRKYLQLPDEGQGAWVENRWDEKIYTIKKGDIVPLPVLASALLAYRIQKGLIYLADDKNDPLLQMADVTNCKDYKHPYATVGLYWSEEKLFVEQDYCHIQGGGIWEADWE